MVALLAATVFVVGACGPPPPKIDVSHGTGPEGEPVRFRVQMNSQGAGNPDTASAAVRIYCTTIEHTGQACKATPGVDYVPLDDAHGATVLKGSRHRNLSVHSLDDGVWECCAEVFDILFRVEGPATIERSSSGQIT